MLTVQCQCGANYNAPERFAGRSMRCKRCSAVLTIPAPETAPETPPEKDLEETAVMGNSDREEMERTRPRAGKKKSFKPPKKGAGKKSVVKKGGKKKSFAKKKGVGRRGAAPRRGDVDAAGSKEMEEDRGGSKSRMLLLVLLLVVVIGGGGAVYYFFFMDKTPTVATDDSGKPAADDDDDDATSGDDDDDLGAADDDDDDDSDLVDLGDDDDDDAMELPSAPIDLLSLVPADAGFVVQLSNLSDLGAFADAYETHPMLGGMIKNAKEQTEGTEVGEAEAFLEKAGVELQDIDRIVVAGAIPADALNDEAAEELEAPEDLVALVQGSFDATKLVAAVREEYGSGSSRKIGDLEFWPFEDEGSKAHIAALTSGQVVAAGGAYLDKVVSLLDGEGDAIGSNEALSGVAGSFGKGHDLAIAVALPAEARAKLSEVPAEMANFIPSWNEIYIGLDLSNDGALTLGITGRSSNVDEVKLDENRVKMAVNVLLGSALPPPLQPYLKKIEISSAGQLVDVNLPLSREDIDGIVGIVMQLMAGGPPAPGDDDDDGFDDDDDLSDDGEDLPDLDDDDDF